MSTSHSPKSRAFAMPRTSVLGMVLLLAVLVPGQTLAADAETVARSLLVPGSGQAQQGNFTKAAIFAGAAVVSAAGLFITQVHYNQSSDKFDASKADYTDLTNLWASGGVVNVVDLDNAYQGMIDASSEADQRLKWRNVFLTTLVATYTINLIDVLISKPHDAETAARYQVEATPSRVLLTRSFGF